MTQALQVLQYAVSLEFVLLALITAGDYLRHRERSRGYLALAIGLLGLVSLISLLQQSNGPLGDAVADLAVGLLLASGYALLLFRGVFIPLSSRSRWLAFAGMAAVEVLFCFFNVSSERGSLFFSYGLTFATALFVLAWSACVLEPIIRFWQAASDLPAVQKGRLRALSVGYSALVAILLFAGIAQGVSRQPLAQLITQLVALLVAPLLYVAFSPPRWLRREWMYPEEVTYRDAVQQMILFSPTRVAMADRAVEWAIRFVGAEAGFIVDPDGTVLAAKGISEATVKRLHENLSAPGEYPTSLGDGAPQTAIVVPLPLSSGTGVLGVVSGPFTPFFGNEEVGRLTGYATNITAGLDRAGLTERIAAIERTKTEFLNLASHELRGPITVIRGYLSMLDRGSLGEIPQEARRALPVLTAKADEMNALVEQMIEAARLEEGRLELTTRRADLREVARQAVEMAEPFNDEKHALVFEGPDIEVPVLIDVERISTVVGNLLTNAIKYSPAGGDVTCSVSLEDHKALVAVKDHGVGIPPDRFDRLFTRFGRIVTPETSHIPGTGLGLYLSRELARLHGGDLTASSVLGKGSTFTLAVPLMEEANT